jgi:hypothetical protein
MPIGRTRGYWKDKKKQKEFFDQLAVKWNIQKMDDWNKVTAKMLLDEGGGFIKIYYSGSPRCGMEYKEMS